MYIHNRNYRFKKLFILIIVCFIFVSVKAQLIINDTHVEFISIRPQAELFLAGQETYSIDDILRLKNELPFSPLTNYKENYGFSDDNFWMKFEIQNDTERTVNYYLETGRPFTDEITLYQFGPDGRKDTQYSGDQIAFKQKSVMQRKSVFTIHLLPGETTSAFIHMKSDGQEVMLPLRLYSQNEFMFRSYNEQLFNGIFYGILMLAFIINLFFFFALKDSVFVYYSCYVLSIAMLQFALDGFFHQYVLPGGGRFLNQLTLASGSISIIFLFKYIGTFLRLKYCLRSMHKLFIILSVIVTICFIALFMAPKYLVLYYPITNLVGFTTIMLVIYSIVVLKFKKAPVDIFFMAGISFLILGFVLFILNNFNLVPNSFFTENGAKFGIGLEVIFLSISMSKRIQGLRMENEMNHTLALQRAEDMNEMKSSFLSNISHELRTPLNLIIGVATSLKNTKENNNPRENYDLILKSSETLLGYIEDILDFTIIEKEGQKLEKTSFDLASVIQRTIYVNKRKAEIKGLRFDFSLSEELPKKVIGDPTKLKQILNNLLDNAIKFTSLGSIKVHLEPVIIKGESIKLKITITDTGIGITTNKMSTMYESFAKRSYLDKREFSGLGLGLYIVKTYVDLYDGTIKISNNNPKPGTNCSVVLEFQLAEDSLEDESFNQVEVLENQNHHLDRCDILLVEDNKMNQMVINMFVKNWKNFTLTIANNGQEALEKIKEKSFDLILMDLQMPIMDGFETMSIIKSGEAGAAIMDIPIIVITADITENTKREVLRLGANDYMTKPVNRELLLSMITKNISQTWSKEHKS